MRKIIFTIAMLLAVNTAIYAASDSNDKESVSMENKSDKPDRDDGVIPEVNYDNANGTLDITYDSSENCFIEVKDSNSKVVYEAPISTNGVEQSYNINIKSDDYYKITIKSSDGVRFEGYLYPNL